MALLDDLLEGLDERDTPVRDVRLGLRATAVWSDRLGLAYAFPRDPYAHGREGAGGAERLIDMSARELAELSRASDLESASIGIAAINSLIAQPERLEEGEGFEVILRHGRSRHVALVGHFPFADRLRPLVRELTILELHPREGDLPASESARVLPAADVVVITASSLINHTLEGLLAQARGKPVIFIGPSAPLSPVLLDHGITVVCGSLVLDPQEALRDVSEAVSFRRMHGLRRVVLE
jgi:uncharacterized protein (DUF4213/DUF364 family)